MLMVTVPHSGERIPPEAPWLLNKDRLLLLTDVDRFVHELYAPGCKALGVPLAVMDVHRYVVDLNRLPTDIDNSCVLGAGPSRDSGFVSGFHWVRTTQGEMLMEKPLLQRDHEILVKKYYDPFHAQVRKMQQALEDSFDLPLFHIDAHSMPSQGTGAHRDSGKPRPDIVVSDCSGKSCLASFKDAVIAAFEAQGFLVSYNWPYLGGRMTEQYGKPDEGRHAVQVEINRKLYMDEFSREKTAEFSKISVCVTGALKQIYVSCQKMRAGT